MHNAVSLKIRVFLICYYFAADFGEQEEDVDIVTVQDALLTQALDDPSMVRLSGQHSTCAAQSVVPGWYSSA